MWQRSIPTFSYPSQYIIVSSGDEAMQVYEKFPHFTLVVAPNITGIMGAKILKI
jgi:hypothetical protein